MFLNPSHAVYWLMPRGIPFLPWMYAFIAWLLSTCWTLTEYQPTGCNSRALFANVALAPRKEFSFHSQTVLSHMGKGSASYGPAASPNP